MIEVITLRGVTSYSNTEGISLQTTKRINLVYGHNGTGKSTISNFLQSREDLDYLTCSIQHSGPDLEILVYNQTFIERNFFESSHPGIFTLSEHNKDAEIQIENAEKAIEKLSAENGKLIEQGLKIKAEQDQERLALKEKVWEAKSKYERTPLDFCLEGFKGNKDKFIEQVRQAAIKDADKIIDSQLREEATELQSRTDAEKPNVDQVAFSGASTECNPIFQEVIVGSTESYLSQLIQHLGNSDWVKEGQQYLSESSNDCPFCQQELPIPFKHAISELFDQVYQSKITTLKTLSTGYENSILELQQKIDSAPFKSSYVLENEKFERIKTEVFFCLNSNLACIRNKISSPSAPIQLKPTNILIISLNDCIKEISQKIQNYNERVRNKKSHLGEIKKRFWSMVRNQFDSALTLTDEKVAKLEEQLKLKRDEVVKLKETIAIQKNLIAENRGKITNIDSSIERINTAIESLGLQGFKLEKDTKNPSHYRIARETNAHKIYKTLSEGEKTLITFLYFLECCIGSLEKQSAVVLANRIIVIDDPISSLSHNYVYDIASLIQYKVIEAGFRQVFILTHNLFFFHELLKLKDYCEDKSLKKNYALFRVTKNTFSQIQPMKDSDIRNDYQSYWEVLKDCKAGKVSGIVLPNMMRNILEYYFNFVHQQASLKRALTKLSEDETEFSALFRYINRQSHSDAVNIHDFGVIDPVRYLEKFREVFKETNFEHHFDMMMGQDKESEDDGKRHAA